MKQKSKKDRFYSEVGEAMAMGECRSFINMETLKVDIHASEDYFIYDNTEEEDSAKEAIENPGTFMVLSHYDHHNHLE